MNLTPFSQADFRRVVHRLAELAQQTDRGIVLAEALVELLRQQGIILPALYVIERVCSEAHTRGTRQAYQALTAPLAEHHRRALDGLLAIRENPKVSVLAWLGQPPGPPRPKHILANLERLKAIRELWLPGGLEQAIHQNHLLKLTREGGQMTAQHLRDFEPTRRHATLVAVILDTRATLIDEIIDLHDRFLGALFSKAKRKHAERFQESGKAINDKIHLYSRIGRALLDAKQSGNDPFAAIEAIIPWERFSESITEAEKLAQPKGFDYLSLVVYGFNQLRRYTPIFLESLTMKAAPTARELLTGVEVLKDMNARQARKVPDDAPTSFVRKRWVERLAAADELPDAAITNTGRLKIRPLNNAVPDEAEVLMQQAYSLLPHLKITDLLLEVDNWTDFTRHFKHLKNDAVAENRNLLLTTILADAINLGLSKMAESCPGTTYAKLTWLQAWHIRDETYSAALAELVNAQFRQPFAAYWGDGTTSSSDGQNFRAGGRGQHAGQVNLKYGQEPGVQFYTHISDQYTPFHQGHQRHGA